MYLVFDVKTRKEISRHDNYHELYDRMPLPVDHNYRWVGEWTTADGVTRPTCDMDTAHLINIVKYLMSQNRRPSDFIMDELEFRGQLKVLADLIPPQEGYKSPAQLYAEHCNAGPATTMEVPDAPAD
jgi:hypothetical protein